MARMTLRSGPVVVDQFQDWLFLGVTNQQTSLPQVVGLGMGEGDQGKAEQITMELLITADIPKRRQVQHRFPLNLPLYQNATELMSGGGMQEPKLAQFVVAIPFIE